MGITGHPPASPPARDHVVCGHRTRRRQGNPGGGAGAHPNWGVLPKRERSGASPGCPPDHPPEVHPTLDVIILQETNTTLYDPPADWGDYSRVAVSSASWRNQGIRIYLHKRTPWRVDLEFANTLGSALCGKVYTHDTHLFILAVHAPQTRRGYGGKSLPAPTLAAAWWWGMSTKPTNWVIGAWNGLATRTTTSFAN